MKEIRSSYNRPVADTIKRVDIFGLPVLGFNIDGASTIKTVIGGIVTLAISAITLLFALYKFQAMLQRRNPVINQHTELNANSDDGYDLSQPDFQIAVGIQNMVLSESLDDPGFVRWGARVYHA